MTQTRILIVDDEAEAGEILTLRLKRRGMLPVWTPSGEAALSHVREHPVDVVLLDMKMPGMDGIEVLRHLRRDHPDITVIMLSGHADMQTAATGLELGAFSYQLKPVDLDDLCHKIEDACRQKALENGGG